MSRFASRLSAAISSLFAGLSRAERRQRSRHDLVGSASLWKMKRDFQLAFLLNRGLQPGHKVVDIGCGTLRGGIPIIEYLDEGNYYGIEAREEALAEARRELEQHRLAGKGAHLVHASDLKALSLPTRFDFAWAFSVLFHMPDEVLDGCIDFVGRQLAAGGSLYANVHIGSRNPKRWKEFPVVWRSLEQYRALGARHGLEVEDIGSLYDVGHRSGRSSHDQQRVLRFHSAGE